MAGNQLILDTLKAVAACVAETFGPTCEVVIHDLKSREIVAIENGHVTGRKKGDRLSEEVYDYLVASAKAAKKMTGYASRTHGKGNFLKCSTLLVSDEQGEPVAAFCLNIDIEQLKRARDALDTLLATTPLVNIKNGGDDEKPSVTDYTRKIIAEVIQKVGKPIPPASKEGKLQVVRELDAHGVFLVRDVVPAVCEILGISQATLYNYLREVRCENGAPPLWEK